MKITVRSFGSLEGVGSMAMYLGGRQVLTQSLLDVGILKRKFSRDTTEKQYRKCIHYRCFALSPTTTATANFC